MLTLTKKPKPDLTSANPPMSTGGLTSRRAVLAGGLSAAFTAISGVAAAQSRIGAPGGQMLGGGLSGGARALPPGAKPPGPGTFTGNYSGANNGGSTVVRSWGNVNLRLLRKINYGPTPEDMAEIDQLGYATYLDRQLDYLKIDDSACEAEVAIAAPLVNKSLQELNQLSLSSSYLGWESAVDAMLVRSARSKRQLYQRMCEFWHDHFYVYAGTHLGVYLHYEREVIWANALGTFKDILSRSANHGLMMLYLNNNLSSDKKINVNYARELLELHTVGVNGGYTEDDIYALADILTGWNVDTETAFNNYGSFVYRDNLHANGSRTVMGQAFPQSGKAQGDAVLSWLSAHPATIKYIADKLCEWFLGKPASPNMLQAIGDAWGPEGDIKAVLRVILHSNNVSMSEPIFKRPFHLLVGAVRQTGVPVTSGTWMRSYLREAGMSIGDWVQPDAYPNGFSYWSGGMVKRFKLMTHVANGRMGIPVMDLSSMTSMSDAQKIGFVNNRFFLGELPVSDQIWIRRYVKGTNKHRQAIAIALCAPSYQWF